MNDREKFEDTFSLIHSTASKELLFETRKDGRYASLVTNSAYEMWKAATADSAARIAELENVLEYLMNTCPPLDLSGEEAHELAKAITNTGDKT